MKIITLYYGLLLIVGCCLTTASCRTPRHFADISKTHDATSRFTLIIFYDKIVGNKPLLRAVKKYNANLLYVYKNFNGVAISLPSSIKEATAINYFKQIKGVLSVQRDKQLKLNDNPPVGGIRNE